MVPIKHMVYFLNTISFYLSCIIEAKLIYDLAISVLMNNNCVMEAGGGGGEIIDLYCGSIYPFGIIFFDRGGISYS